MTNERHDERKKLLALADALFDDLFETSDEEILREMRESGQNPELLKEEMKGRFEALAAERRKERMHTAERQLAAYKARPFTAEIVDIADARRAVNRAMQQDGISLAARNETTSELTDNEILQKYRDLVRLGVIKPD